MRRDPTSWMLDQALELLGRAERLQRQFFRLQVARELRPAWEPPVDVFELDDGVLVLVALPGVPSDRLRIELDGPLLLIRGERPLPAMSGDARIRRLEIPHGHFERSVELPGGRLEVREQSLCDGCLTLVLGRCPGGAA